MNTQKKILVTGGLGYIGSHTILQLLEQGFDVVCIDNLSNSHLWIKEQIEKISNKQFTFHNADILNYENFKNIISNNSIDTVIHFAAYKAVGESVLDSLKYYENNLVGLINVLKVCNELNIENLVFSSSATVYGDAKNIPVNENSELQKPASPYGETKIWGEDIINAWAKSYGKKAVILRYFNPIGGHVSGTLGELPMGIPSNLVPYITQTAIGKREKLSVFGNDYNTSDGSCIRDFIDVNDLASAHVKAIDYFDAILNSKNTNENTNNKTFCPTFCLGTGKGVTVLELIKTFEKVNDIKIKYDIIGRREGDVEAIYCSNDLAVKELGWEPQVTLGESLRSAYLWENFLGESGR